MIRFEPYYMPLVWGGRRFESKFGRALPEGPIGESWELVELPEQHSVAADGAHKGKKLGDLWRAGVLGGSAQGPFPFLLKWIDAAQKLSVQVHPPESVCKRTKKGRPKTEAWYVVDVTPEAKLMMGHFPGFDSATLKLAAANQTLGKWLYETHPSVGDIFLLESGTVHAIGDGCLLLEVQQPSDTTYRIYDWGRMGIDGKPRQLHLEDAAMCIDYAKSGPVPSQRQGVVGPCFRMRGIDAGTKIPEGGLRVLVADQQHAVFQTAQGTLTLQTGEVICAEPKDGVLQLVSGHAILLGEP